MVGVTYLTMDSVTEGVGASQVWPYVSRLAHRGQPVRLVSFEKIPRDLAEIPALVDWAPRHFRRGRMAPFRRIAAAALEARSSRSRVLHARSDLPAMAAMLARHPCWVWDVRAFWREQRIELGGIHAGSPTDWILQRVEATAAQRSAAIICLSAAAKETLRARFGEAIADKITVIPTAVDTQVFRPGHRRSGAEIRVLLSGSYNSFYDGSLMARLLGALRDRTPVHAEWIGADRRSPLWDALRPVLDAVRGAVPFDEVPVHVLRSDVGLAVCRADAGPALRAAMPTKIAEFLATGRPVVVNRGLGDMDAILSKYRCGIAVSDRTHRAIEAAADELLDLLADGALSERARACALDVFDLGTNVARLHEVYRRVAGSGS